MIRHVRSLIIFLSIALMFSGCSSYRTSSNIETSNFNTAPLKSIAIFEEGNQPIKNFTKSRLIEVSVKKLTAFHDDPTKEQANSELQKTASVLDCDAVVDVVYKSGVGFITWGYIEARGYCAIFD